MESLHWKIKLFLYQAEDALIWRLSTAVQLLVSEICTSSMRVTKLSLFEVHVLYNHKLSFRKRNVITMRARYFFINLKTNAPIYACTFLTLRHSVMLFCVEVTQGI